MLEISTRAPVFNIYKHPYLISKPQVGRIALHAQYLVDISFVLKIQINFHFREFKDGRLLEGGRLFQGGAYQMFLCLGWVLTRGRCLIEALRQLYIINEQTKLFWTPGLPDGVHGNRPSPLVRWSVGPSSNISETARCFFLIFCRSQGTIRVQKGQSPIIKKDNYTLTFLCVFSSCQQ